MCDELLIYKKYTTGEITAFMPVTGGFVRHATAFVEPALGAATGWNFCESAIGVSKSLD
jgi:amino acid transporter